MYKVNIFSYNDSKSFQFLPAEKNSSFQMKEQSFSSQNPFKKIESVRASPPVSPCLIPQMKK